MLHFRSHETPKLSLSLSLSLCLVPRPRRRNRAPSETGCEICIIRRGTFVKSTRGPRSRAKDIYISLYSQRTRRKRTKTSHLCRAEKHIFSRNTRVCVSLLNFSLFTHRITYTNGILYFTTRFYIRSVAT